MSRNQRTPWQIALLVSLAALPAGFRSAARDQTKLIGTLQSGAKLVSFQSDAGHGMAVIDAGSASVRQSQPVQLEFLEGANKVTNRSAGYNSISFDNGKAEGIAHLAGPGKSTFTFRDQWTIHADVLQLARTVTVSGSDSGNFLTSVTLTHPSVHPRTEVDYFAPGMIYGGTSHLSQASIGGPDAYNSTAQGRIRIREDRLPAPLFGVRFADGSSLTLLDPAPKGDTTKADSEDTAVRTLSDERFLFGAIGTDLEGGHHAQGFWFPGSEGEITYRGNTYPGGQVHQWRRRYHPIRDGLVQQYRIQFRFARGEDFPAYMRNAWRWAYSTLKPVVTWKDISAVRRSIVDLLASQVESHDGRAGIANAVPAVTNSEPKPNRRAIMGFTGKNLEAAEFLLADAGIDDDKARASRDRKLGLDIFSSFIRLRMNPPVGEGFDLDTGQPALAIPRDHCVFLRSFGDDMKATVRAYWRERNNGTTHEPWLQWTQQFGDWLLLQQTNDGGFPRSWKPESGEVADASPQSSYNPVPFLVLLSQETGDSRYRQAAERAADFVWSHGQREGRFVGGTIDNPDVLDKEAGTLSLEAYIALYEATHHSKWLMRARAAADFAETWIYLWNVPMPADAGDESLHWKRGVPTSGTQLIASGHSLVDDYMSFDVDEYTKLGSWGHDDHYLAVAKLLLHNTKNMVPVPGRTFDLKGPGWQQEHYSLAPIRGRGLHRLWLPWVATSQLNGIFELLDFDPTLFQQWTEPQSKKSNTAQ